MLDCVIEASSSSALYVEAIRRNLLSRLDLAAYLGGELARGELALRSGEAYLQDRAPGQPWTERGLVERIVFQSAAIISPDVRAAQRKKALSDFVYGPATRNCATPTV